MGQVRSPVLSLEVQELGLSEFRLIDGEWTDETINDPLSEMVNLLVEKRDRTLSQQWGIWLVKRNQERGLKVWPVFYTKVVLFNPFNLALNASGYWKTPRATRGGHRLVKSDP